MKKILMVLAPKDFRDIEFIVPKAFWKQKGFDIITISTVAISKGAFGYQHKNDLLLKDATVQGYDALFFVGGYGSVATYLNDETAKNLAVNFIMAKKPVGSICVAPRCFLNWGILKGKKMTGWNDDNVLQDMSEKNDATYTGETVTVDGLLLTADGPTASEECAIAFANML